MLGPQGLWIVSFFIAFLSIFQCRSYVLIGTSNICLKFSSDLQAVPKHHIVWLCLSAIFAQWQKSSSWATILPFIWLKPLYEPCLILGTILWSASDKMVRAVNNDKAFPETQIWNTFNYSECWCRFESIFSSVPFVIVMVLAAASMHHGMQFI